MRALVRSTSSSRCLDVQPLLIRAPRRHVEAAVIDGRAARRGPRILHAEHDAARVRQQWLLEVRVGIEEHRAGAVVLAADAELALEDVPDLREIVLVAWVMRAGLVTDQAGVGLGGP